MRGGIWLCATAAQRALAAPAEAASQEGLLQEVRLIGPVQASLQLESDAIAALQPQCARLIGEEETVVCFTDFRQRPMLWLQPEEWSELLKMLPSLRQQLRTCQKAVDELDERGALMRDYSVRRLHIVDKHREKRIGRMGYGDFRRPYETGKVGPKARARLVQTTKEELEAQKAAVAKLGKLAEEVADTYGSYKDRYMADVRQLLQDASDETREAYLSDMLNRSQGAASSRGPRRPSFLSGSPPPRCDWGPGGCCPRRTPGAAARRPPGRTPACRPL